MSLVLLGSTSGSVTLQEPAVAGSTVIDLPATSGTMALTSDTIAVANGGTGQTSYTNGQLLIGNTTGNTLTKATLTAGTGISITNGTGSITIANTASVSAATPTALGTVYGLTPIAGAQNVSIGYNVLNAITTGVGNVGFGLNTLQANTTGQENSAFGGTYFNEAPLKSNTTGSNNSAYGAGSLRTNTTGSYNVAYGTNSLQGNTTASNNTAVGYQAMNNTTTGASNTTIGYQAGYSIGTGSNNVCIGRADVSVQNVTHEITIATAGVGGKGSSTGFISPNGGGVYQGNNGATWSVTSDQRLKKNIVNNNIGLDIINQIQVRNFEYRLPEEVTELDSQNAVQKIGVQLGVIAQELHAVLPDCVKTESTGVMSVQSDNLTWYMINAIKELKSEFDAYKASHP